MLFKLKLKTLQNVRGSAGQDTHALKSFNYTEEWKNRGKLMAEVASRWSPASLHVKLKSATRLPAIERIRPHSRGGLLQPCPLSKLAMKALIFKTHIKFTHLSPAGLSPPSIVYSIVLHKSVN